MEHINLILSFFTGFWTLYSPIITFQNSKHRKADILHNKNSAKADMVLNFVFKFSNDKKNARSFWRRHLMYNSLKVLDIFLYYDWKLILIYLPIYIQYNCLFFVWKHLHLFINVTIGFYRHGLIQFIITFMWIAYTFLLRYN